ncbi:MAG: hypothetical protein JSS02_07895 [Planctomycetes bacterium]|nr:hypothetical protein [Planctomycetota bacterium]
MSEQYFAELQRRGQLSRIESRWFPNATGVNLNLKRARLSEMSVGRTKQRNVQIASGNLDLLGMPFFSGCCVTFDFPGRAVYFQPRKVPDNLVHEDLSGLVAVRRNDVLVAQYVWPKGPAATAGLIVGDRIEALNGDAAAEISPSRLRRILAAEGKVVRLAIDRDGHKFETSVELRDYYLDRIAAMKAAISK